MDYGRLQQIPIPSSLLLLLPLIHHSIQCSSSSHKIRGKQLKLEFNIHSFTPPPHQIVSLEKGGLHQKASSPSPSHVQKATKQTLQYHHPLPGRPAARVDLTYPERFLCSSQRTRHIH
ncbi:hypothetical protein GOP47_0000149 [Adiantum capillus-veneris]|uniref:Uncharacterized protein n=1 Tax=Adiantum capillus-veneris TaxID=13818 RepID=A0A9D4ZSU3_ADICA|nr:hypothetical protein GOP47_0000149 [Adiantum capillus-veneris]